eukprot:1304966-Prymnesium_polylepis.1
MLPRARARARAAALPRTLPWRCSGVLRTPLTDMVSTVLFISDTSASPSSFASSTSSVGCPVRIETAPRPVRAAPRVSLDGGSYGCARSVRSHAWYSCGRVGCGWDLGCTLLNTYRKGHVTNKRGTIHAQITVRERLRRTRLRLARAPPDVSR